jgi:pimeloyl-ACP methyl ester carboxylesterase
MTLTEADPAPVADDDPIAVVADVDGVPISGLLAVAAAPRAVLIALHGGGTTSAYFDSPGRPQASLLRAAAALGYTVLALDRPGYGSSSGADPQRLTDPGHRVELVFAAIEAHLTELPRGAGLFLASHSAASELALRMAADPRGEELLGLELAGAGYEFQPEVLTVFESLAAQGRRPRVPAERLWQPNRLYPPDIVGGKRIGAPRPPHETNPASYWSADSFPDLAARIRIPVRYTVGDHESVWRNDPAFLAGVGGLFAASPRVVVHRQWDTGHNISVGHTAHAYHLGLLAFVAECAAGRIEQATAAI